MRRWITATGGDERRRRQLLLGGLTTAATLWLLIAGNAFAVYLAGLVLIYSISAVGLNWLMGWAGQVSMGNAALMAVGAYTTGILSQQPVFGITPIPIFISMIVGGLVGLVVGLPALRLRGMYLALSTLSLQFIITFAALQYQESAGLLGGLSVPTFSLATFQLSYGTSYVLFLLGVLVLVLILLSNAYRRMPGRMWLAIKDQEVAAAAIGVNVTRTKLVAFVGSSMLIALSGSLLAYYSQLVSGDAFSLDFAIGFIVMIIVGGMGSMAGAVLGAALVTLAPYVLTALTGLLPTDLPITGWLSRNIFLINNGLYGVILLLFLLYQPGGIADVLTKVERWTLRKLRVAAHPGVLQSVYDGSPFASSTAPPDGEPGLRARSATPLLEVSGLSVVYPGGGRAVDRVTVAVPQKRIVALLGRNGAGKSSLLRAICGFFTAEGVRVTGSVRFDGQSIDGGSPMQARRLGVELIPERDKVFTQLTVQEHLRLAGGGLEPSDIEREHFSNLWSRLKSPAGLLSGGERQMLALAMAFRRQPKLLLIDELSLGLAPIVIGQLLTIVKEFHERTGTSILLVEQNAVAALGVADDAYVLEGGRIMAAGPARQIASDRRLRLAYLGA